jgi:predicted permease
LFAAGRDRDWSLEELKAVCSNVGVLPLVFFSIALTTYWMEKSLRGARHLTAPPRPGLVKSLTSAWSVPGVRYVVIVVALCQFLLFMSVYVSAKWPTQPMNWDHFTTILDTVPAMAFKAAVCVFAGLAFAWPAVERRRHHAEWSRLPIEMPS